MNEINIIDLEFNEITSISTVERHYGEFKVKVKLDDNKWYDVVHKTPYGEKTILFSESTAQRLIKEYGEPTQKLGYTFIHDPRLWEEPLEDNLW